MNFPFSIKKNVADFDSKNNVAHIYHGSIENYLSEKEILFALLDTEEKQKAQSFKFEKDKNLYTISHGILRKVLSAYSGIDSDKISFLKNSFGKPSLTTTETGIEFNLSHSAKSFAIAIAKQNAIGVDIEELNTSFIFDAIVNEHFSAEEKNIIADSKSKHKIFFELWTQKEAYLKMKGVGLNKKVDSNNVKQSCFFSTQNFSAIIISVCCVKKTTVEYFLI